MGAAVRLPDAAVEGGGVDRGLDVCLGAAFAVAAAEGPGGAVWGCWAGPGSLVIVCLLGGFLKEPPDDDAAAAAGVSVAECALGGRASVDAAGVCAPSLVKEPFLAGALLRSDAGVLPLCDLAGAGCNTVGSGSGGWTVALAELFAAAEAFSCAACAGSRSM